MRSVYERVLGSGIWCIRCEVEGKPKREKVGWRQPPGFLIYQKTVDVDKNPCGLPLSVPNPTIWHLSEPIDLVLETAPKERWAIEIKRSFSDPKPSKGFYIGCSDVKANHQIVVYPGQESYKHDPKTEITPLDRLLKRLSQ